MIQEKYSEKGMSLFQILFNNLNSLSYKKYKYVPMQKCFQFWFDIKRMKDKGDNYCRLCKI